MITFQQARQIAEAEISKQHFSDNDILIIIDELTIEKEYAWIFSYTSKRYWETNDIMHAVAGNGPLFVSKSDGQVSNYRTGLSIDGMIDEHEEVNKIWNLILPENSVADLKQLLALKHLLNIANDKIWDYKEKINHVLDSGSKTRLMKIQNQLALKNIKSELVQNDIIDKRRER